MIWCHKTCFTTFDVSFHSYFTRIIYYTIAMTLLRPHCRKQLLSKAENSNILFRLCSIWLSWVAHICSTETLKVLSLNPTQILLAKSQRPLYHKIKPEMFCPRCFMLWQVKDLTPRNSLNDSPALSFDQFVCLWQLLIKSYFKSFKALR